VSAQLEEKLSSLAAAGIGPELVGKIRAFVNDEPAPRLFRISPYRLAQEWGVAPKSALDAFLVGTRQGIFDLEWSIRCRSCFGPADVQSSLSSLQDQADCHGCKIEIRNASLDTDVEVSFNVARGVRQIEHPKVHDVIKAWIRYDLLESAEIPPGREWVHRADMPAGSYKIFTDDFSTRAAFLIEGKNRPAEEEFLFDCTDGGLRWHSAARPPGRYAIKVKNSTARPLRLNFAHAAYSPWVSGLDVASNQFFRDMFSQELVSADASFSVKNVVLLFTDIRGSTNLYERRGDARAYALVKDHFQILFDSVRRHNGALVKTIGDAVMATFVGSADALAAIFDVQARFDLFNRERPAENAIIIKAGLHCGTCIAVTLNDTLDYFGRTVNLAARIQGESHGGDIVLSRTIYECGGIAELASAAGWDAAPRSAALKGIDDPIDLVTLTRRGGPKVLD
jgi:class 3 adenylate cyclase